ncbi:MAG: sugar/nucleoside kinase (ribokinase family) [Paracoccaceae bacterium]|jgi:sugar/nucleoside kinase (ribokinase family)
MNKTYQVVGIGNAMVDILSHIKDDFLAENGVKKGVMQLIDMDRAVELYSHMGPAKEISGGSAANTIAGIAALGGKTAYVGKVKDDQLGAIFAHDLRAQGATYETPLAPTGPGSETGRCMVLVTPDGERSLNTYLGWSEFLGPDDIDTGMMADAEWLYLEGYRFDGPESKAAFAKAIDACKGAGGKISLTLSDPFCVDRHRDDFLELIRDHVDLLFCNVHEMQAMYPAADLQASMNLAAKEIEIVACTASDDGAYVLHDGRVEHAKAVPSIIVDATGAGDLFASGFLYGLTNGFDMLTCGSMGCVAAGEVIGHIGARPEADLMNLFKENGLI